MKRIVIFVAALACGFGAQAQQLDKDLEKAGNVRDSIAVALAKHRADYAVQNDSIREKMAPTILSLEKALASAQTKYEVILANITSRDVGQVLSSYEASIKADTVVKVEQPVVEEKKEGATIADEFNALFDNQQQVEKIKALVAQYHTKYNELKALHAQYMKVPTKREADSVAALFNAKNEELVALNNQIASQWHMFYYDQIYKYNLLVERTDNMQKFSDSQIRGQIKDLSGKYSSDAVADYSISREALLNYEMKIASSLLLTSSFEKLQGRLTELRKTDYKLPKLSLERRNFIRYENISTKAQSFYNSANPVPKTQVEDYGTVYRISIGSYSRKLTTSSLRGVKPVSYTYNDDEGKYTYFVGGFRTEAEAKLNVKRLKDVGFDAVVAVWVDGNYYSTVAEMHSYESRYIVKISGVTTLSEDVVEVLRSHNGECEIKRDGVYFVVGPYLGQNVANKVAAEIKALNSEIEAVAEKQNLN